MGTAVLWEALPWTRSAVGEHVLRGAVWKTFCLAVATERCLS